MRRLAEVGSWGRERAAERDDDARAVGGADRCGEEVVVARLNPGLMK